jgi:outer membrane biosynthesis protein TonB
MVINPFSSDEALMANWYHPRCFFVHRFKAGHPTSTKAFAGFDDLEKEDQKELTALVKGGHIPKEKAAKAKEAKASPKAKAASSRKKKKDEDKDDEEEAASPAPKKKTAGTKRKAKAAAAEPSDEEEEEEEEEAPKAKKAKASTKKATPAAAAASSSKKKGGAVFAGLTFCLSGNFSVKKAEIEAKVTSNGGKVAGGVTKVVTHVASNEWAKGGEKCSKAKSEGKTCVTEEWIDKAIAAGSLPKADA